MWVKHHSFRDTVAESWNGSCHFTGMRGLQCKLTRLKEVLKNWNWSMFGNITSRVTATRTLVEEAKTAYAANRSEENLIATHKASAELNRTLAMEEAFWCQKAACRWLADGERNTQYFHNLVKHKTVRNRIHSIEDNGVVLEGQEEITASAANFFENLLSRDNIAVRDEDLAHIEPCFPASAADSLCTTPSEVEIRNVIFSIDKDSVAGPDGFNSYFYQQCWDIVKQDVVSAVTKFYSGIPIPKAFTCTTIVLIPKIENPTSWKDFRPTSLCNVTNKILTKSMALRIAHLLPSFISPSQSGFSPGRAIVDNTLLAQELISLIDKKTHGGRAVLKLDMAKAYDRVHWPFLLRITRKLGFRST